MVAGDHNGADAGAPALGNGIFHLGPHRIDHTGQTQEGELPLQVGGRSIRRNAVPNPAGSAQHPQRPACHGLVGRQDLLTARFGQLHPAALQLHPGTPLQHLVRRTFGKLQNLASSLMQGGHHLPAGIKGRLCHPGRVLLHPVFVQSLLGGPSHQGRFRGLAQGLAGGVQLGVRAQGHGPSRPLQISEMIHHRHLILGQGAGLVRANDLCAAQRLHRSEPPYDGIPLGHIGNADGQHHRHHRGEPFRNGRHRQRHRHHKGIHHHTGGEGPGPQKLHAENHQADPQHQPGQHFGQLAQLPLQRRLPILGLRQRTSDFTHLRVHARGSDHGRAPAIDHGGPHIDHVLPVSQGDVLPALPEMDEVYELIDRNGLSRESRLFDFEACALQNPPVGGDSVAGLQQHHIACHQIFTADGHHLTIPQNLGGGCGHLLQRLNGFLRLVLLIHSQDSIDHHHEENDNHIRKALVLIHCQHTANGGGRQQYEGHGICQLEEKAL